MRLGSRPRRSAGTATPFDVIRRGFRPPSKAAMSGDISAIDRGEPRTLACLYRGTLGGYPKRFRRKMLELHPDALVFRPFWSSPSRTRFRIQRADIISAAPARPDRATAIYSPGAGTYDYAALDVITCHLTGGNLDLAVPRPDVPLVLHYLNLSAETSDQGSERSR
jgi:hypothetical protein